MSEAPNPAIQASILTVGAGRSARYRWKDRLRSSGFRVVDAATRAEALRLALTLRPAAILLASMLADADGFAVCRELKSDPQTASIPVMILSLPAADSYPKAIQAGADAWQRKPIRPSVLVETLRALAVRPRPAAASPSELDSHWRVVAETVPAILCGNRADGTCSYCNRQAYEYTGMPAGSLLGFNWIELIHPEDRPRVREKWLAGIRSGEPFDEEYRLRRADGEFRWFHSHVIPVIDPDSSGLEWFGVSTESDEIKLLREKLKQLVEERTAQLLGEIQERESAQEALRESEARFRGIFENATVGLYRTTPEGRILMANPALISLLGFDSFEDLARRNLEQEGAGPGHSRAEFRRQIESEGVVRGLEASWTRRDGTPVFIRESARVVRGPDGVVCFYDGIIEDFTRRKQAEDALGQSEARFRAIFDQASVGIVQGDLEGRYQVVNDRFCKITGYSRAALLSMRDRDITHPGDLAASVEHARQLLSGEIDQYTQEKRYVRPDGSTIWVRAFGSFLTKHGIRESSIEVVEDISEVKQAEQALQQELAFDAATADLLTRFATCSGPEIDEAIVDSLQTVANYCGADHACVLLGDGEGRFARCTHEWCAPHVTPRISRMQSIPAAGFPWSAQNALANYVVIVDRLDDLPSDAAAERAGMAEEGALATLNVPIEGRKERNQGVIGAIILHRHRSGETWTNMDLTRLRVAGNAIAAVLERKHAEELLRQSEDRFGLVFQASPEAILITSLADQKITDVNPQFLAVSGYLRNEVIGKTTEELRLFVNPMDRFQVWSRLLERQALSDVDLSFRTKSGEVRTGMLSVVMVTVQQQQYLIGMFRDLTERRLAQEALRRQAAFDNLMTGLLSEFVRHPAVEFDGALEQAFSAIAKFFGADHIMLFEASQETDAWGITREWCAPHVSPIRSSHKHKCLWSPARFFSDTDIVIDLADSGPDEGFDLERYRDEGATLVLNVPIKGAAGMVTARIGLHRHGLRTPWLPEDAARLRVAGNAIFGAMERERASKALRESEERFRDLAESVPAAMWIGDKDGSLVFMNRYGIEQAGLPGERLYGVGWTRLVHPDDRERCLGIWSAAVSRRTPFSAEMRLRRPDGSYRCTLQTAVPRLVGGVYLGHFGIGLDITQLKFSHEQHVATQKLESLGVLATGIAHDFNNLLGAIVARAESAQIEIEPGSSVADDLAQIHLTALRAAEIVAQLMTFARQEGAAPAMIDLSSLVAEMLDLLKVSIAKTAILKTNLAPGLPTIRANAAELRQVVMNLIINASEALEGRPGSISITTARAPLDTESATAVRLEVADSGSGMTADVKDRIFDPFFTTRFVGRGLGLSAVVGIVRRHGGSIEVESEPGQGSRFTILLPVGQGGAGLP